MFSILLTYALVGAIAGVLAGLLGIGGGLVIVPMLVFCFDREGIADAHTMHLALGTSMASIVFTSVSSARAHHQRKAVDWTIVKRIVVGILTGTLLGTFVAASLSSPMLTWVFVVFLYYVATQMLLGGKPKATRVLPGRAGMFGAGNVIGVVSSLVGIGGGTLSVPFMVWHNVPVHTAIGTSAAIGFPIAVAGTVGFVLNGWRDGAVPSHAIGYVYLPALAGIVVVSVLFAPLGARLAHALPVDKLKKVFAVLLYAVGTRMLFKLLS